MDIIIPHIFSAHQDFSASHVIKPGDQGYQCGLGGARAADHANGFPGANGKAGLLQHQIGFIPAIGKAHIVKYDGAIRNIRFGIFGVFDFRLLIQHLADTGDGGPGQHERHKQEGEHHQAHQDLQHILDERGKGAQLHVAADDLAAAQPEQGDNAAVHQDLHDGAVPDDHLFRRPLGSSHIIGGGLKFFLLMGGTHEGLHHPDADQVFLNGGVKSVIFLHHDLETGKRLAHDHHDGDQQDGHRDRQNGHQGSIHPESHHHGHYHHDGAAYRHAHQHHHHVLGLVDVCGEAGDQGSSGKFIDILEGIFLHLFKDSLAQIAGKAHAAQGGKPAACHAKAHRNNGHQQHQSPVEQHPGNITASSAFGDDLINQIGGDGGQQHFHHHFPDHHNGAKNQIFFIFARIFEQTKELHG